MSFDWKRKFLSPFKIYPIKNSALRHPICCIGDNVNTLTPRIRNILHFHQHILPPVRLSRQHFSFNKSTIFVLRCQKSTERMAGRNLIDPNGKKNYLGVEGSSLKIDVWKLTFDIDDKVTCKKKTWLEKACCKLLTRVCSYMMSWGILLWYHIIEFKWDQKSIFKSFLIILLIKSSKKSLAQIYQCCNFNPQFIFIRLPWPASIKTQRDIKNNLLSSINIRRIITSNLFFRKEKFMR